jgi:rubredoxin
VESRLIKFRSDSTGTHCLNRQSKLRTQPPSAGPPADGGKPGERIMGKWKCGSCGYELEADKPPDQCPSCKEKCEFLDIACYTPDCQYDGSDKRIG